MKTHFEQREQSLCITPTGRLEGVNLEDSVWSQLRARIESELQGSEILDVYWDLRCLDYVDSRGAYHLLELGQELRPECKVSYVGPGPGVARLEELGQAPHLTPLLTALPWEKSRRRKSSDVPTLLLEAGEYARLIGEDTDFVIDLALEQARLESASDTRDFEVGPSTLSFKKSWQPNDPPPSRQNHPDPSRMLMRDEEPRRDREPRDAFAESSEAALLRQSASGRHSTELDPSALAGLGEVLRALGRSEQERRRLRAYCARLQSQLERSGSLSQEASWRWHEFQRGCAADGLRRALKARWEGLVHSFHTMGQVDATEAVAFSSELNARLCAMTSYLVPTIDAASEASPVGRWRALLLFGSTLNREGWQGSHSEAAVTLGVLATLVDLAPGSEPTAGRCGRDLDDQLARLAFGQTFGLAQYYRSDRTPDALTPEALAQLWRACVALASEERWGGKGWAMALGRAQSRFQGEKDVLSGLQRVLQAHSTTLPGTWVELSNGGVGVSVGACDKSVAPRVLVLFERDSTQPQSSPRSIAPRLFPQEEEQMVTVLHVLDSDAWQPLAPLPEAVGSEAAAADHGANVPPAKTVTQEVPESAKEGVSA